MTTTVHPGVWLVRAGAHGDDEDLALGEGVAVIGFQEIEDLTKYRSVDDIIKAMMAIDPERKFKRAETFGRQLNAFKEKIAVGDIIVLPLKTRPGQIALGRVAGPYEYRACGGATRHTRRVQWVRPDAVRTSFRQDLLYSFGAFMTVCRITRNDAERRVLAVLNGGSDPGFAGEPGPRKRDEDEVEASAPDALDVGQAAHDDIAAFVAARFKGHDLARLVEAVLLADGFITHRSPPGRDGGVDILAARGSLGLDAPTLCVQVKATADASDVNVFRALQGTMQTFGAGQGLLVSWGGFTKPTKDEARQHTFKIRLWDQSDLLQAIYRSYERLPEEIQAELPLKRVWVLVREDVEG